MDDSNLLAEFECETFSFEDDQLYEPMLLDDTLAFDPFLQAFDRWYESTTLLERNWLNSQQGAETMLTLALNGFESYMRLHTMT